MLNWLTDDGIYLPMINDVARNQFYEAMLKDVVKNKDCVDIGFGTGLLSMIAIKHGASHIYAYEKDKLRFDLGKRIINELNLNDKITLVNKKYNNEYLSSDRVVFSEILDENIWGEGLWQCLPKEPSNNFYPSFYFLEVLDIPLPKELFFNQSNWFSPGIELPIEFCDKLNEIILQNVTQEQYYEYTKGLEKLLAKTFQYLLLKDNIKKSNLGGYVVDTTDRSIKVNETRYTIDANTSKIEFSINIDPTTPHLLLPRVGVGANNHKLYLDSATNWGPAAGAKIVGKGISSVKVSQRVDNGITSIIEE